MKAGIVHRVIVMGAMVCLGLASGALAHGDVNPPMSALSGDSGDASSQLPDLDENSVVTRLHAERGHPDAWRDHFDGALREAALTDLVVRFRQPGSASVEGFLETTITKDAVVEGRPCTRITRARWGVRFIVIESENVPFKVERSDITTQQQLHEVVLPKR